MSNKIFTEFSLFSFAYKKEENTPDGMINYFCTFFFYHKKKNQKISNVNSNKNNDDSRMSEFVVRYSQNYEIIRSFIKQMTMNFIKIYNRNLIFYKKG